MSDGFRNLVNKIYKFMNHNDKKYITKLIVESTNYTNTNLHSNLIAISKIVLHYVNKYKLKQDENRQHFIVTKLIHYIQNHRPETPLSPLQFVDIGGGNGNVLSEINKSLGGNKDQFHCIETTTDWIENYNFDNHNITYEFWENNRLSFLDKCCDIALCMVSLHHMNDDTIHNVLSEIKRILADDGLLLIKEHDSNNAITSQFIEWEHYLYHILDQAYKGRLIDVEEYHSTIIDNYKSKEQWQDLFLQHGLHLYSRTNRFLDGEFVPDSKNPTNLYWDVYTSS
jgi:ubiquinone/menaquinone biosynthesis C-methylase UbiE